MHLNIFNSCASHNIYKGKSFQCIRFTFLNDIFKLPFSSCATLEEEEGKVMMNFEICKLYNIAVEFCLFVLLEIISFLM